MRYLIFFSICLLLTANTFAYDWYTNPGSGTETNPFQISEPNQLMAIGSDPYMMDRTYILSGDIIFDPNNNPAHVFTTALIASGTEFRGRFDGNGYRIVNLTITGGDNAGLFDTISFSYYFSTSYVKNVIMENVNISGDTEVGAVCSNNDSGRLDSCTVSGTVNGNDRVGGLCGINDGTITNCRSTCTVNGDDSVGGLCGRNNIGSEISSSYAGGIVNAGGGYQIGGFCGYNGWIIDTSHAAVTITGYGSEIGGFCGWNDGRIITSYATGTIAVNGSNVGGFCGWNRDMGDMISQCYAAVDVEANYNVGGFCGQNNKTIRRSYATGSVTSYGENIGGFCGENTGDLISKCYSTGLVNAYGTDVGGFVGTTEALLEDCFWDIETSGKTIGGYGSGASTGLYGRTAAQMQQQTTFTDYGWDFAGETGNGTEDIWYMEGCPALTYVLSVPTGNGSMANPYRINHYADFLDFCVDTKYWQPGVYTQLNCDLDLSFDMCPRAIGYLDSEQDRRTGGWGWDRTKYRGHFDGNYHVIRNLTRLSTPDTILWNSSFRFAGSLFGVIKDATIVNLGLEDVNLSYYELGALCSVNEGGTIMNCYCTGSVNAEYAAGLCLMNSGSIINCYSTVQVTGNAAAHGFCGSDFVPSPYSGGLGTINSSFWDVQISGIGSEGDDNYGATGKTTQQMQTLSTFTGSGWDFIGESANGDNEIWRMCANGVDYPRFSKQFSQNGDFACGDGVGLEDVQALSSCWLATIDLPTELDDDSDNVVALSEMARMGQYWLQTDCGTCGGIDVTGDGDVDTADLSDILNDWLKTVIPKCSACDGNGDEVIDLQDFAVLGNYW